MDIDVVDLKSFEFWLSFNATILESTNVTVNPLWPLPTLNIMPGLVHVDSGDASSPATGNLTLATMTFHIIAEGGSILDLYNVNLTDKNGNAITFQEPGDGYFNNVFPYDLNGDGVVDMKDIGIAALAYGSYPDHPRWNLSADINCDGEVDIRDLGLICINFGKTCP